MIAAAGAKMKQHVSFINCSFSKILVSVTGLTLLLILIKNIFRGTEGLGQGQGQGPGPPDGRSRGLKTAADGDDAPFIDILREKPKVSFSVSSTLERLVEEERRRHNQSPGYPIQAPYMPGGVAGGVALAGPMGLSHLKASLKDPGFAKKIRDLEDRRQDLYLGLLKKRGQLVTAEDGSQTIVSYPQAPITFPNNLKKNLSEWTEKERVWLNVTHFPWPLDETCNKYTVTFGRNIPVVGLASYPSSGNTWLRYLIEGISGYYSGSMYNDLSLRKRGFYGEGVSADSRLVLTVKTHGQTTEEGARLPRVDQQQASFNHHREVNHSAILVIRNPFAAIIGHRHLDQGGHTGLAKPEEFRGEGWNNFVNIKAAAWLDFYSDWLDQNPGSRLLVLHYENIKISLRHSLRRILRFLGLEEDKGRIACSLRFQKGQFQREHRTNNNTTNALPEDPFTAEQKEVVEAAIQQLDRKLKDYGKETLPTHLYQFYTGNTL